MKCCEYDHNEDGNCHIHSAPGVLRNPALRPLGFPYGRPQRLIIAFNLPVPLFPRGTNKTWELKEKEAYYVPVAVRGNLDTMMVEIFVEVNMPQFPAGKAVTQRFTILLTGDPYDPDVVGGYVGTAFLGAAAVPVFHKDSFEGETK